MHLMSGEGLSPYSALGRVCSLVKRVTDSPSVVPRKADERPDTPRVHVAEVPKEMRTV